MKRLIALVLVIVTVCFCLTSCNKDIVDSLQSNKEAVERLESYQKILAEERKDLTLDLYLIGGEMTEKAQLTVARQITQYTYAKYKTNLNIHYVTTAGEYETVIENYENTVMQNLDNADIILITSEAFFTSLMEQSKLADMTSYLDDDKFASLNVTVTKSLLDAVKSIPTVGGLTYCIPNNHIVAPYTYLKIDLDVMHKQKNWSIDDLKSFNSSKGQGEYDSMKATAQDAAIEYFGMYDERENITAMEDLQPGETAYLLNIRKYPTATSKEVFSAGYSVVNHSDKHDSVRAFEIIYALNTDKELYNMLQYGIKNINYTLDENDKVTRNEDEQKYFMNLCYTGNMFNAYYCDDVDYLFNYIINNDITNPVENQNQYANAKVNFNEKMLTYGKLQNAESVAE